MSKPIPAHLPGRVSCAADRLGCSSTERRTSLQFELFYAGEERLVADAESLGGAGLVEVAVSESCIYLSSLDQTLRTQADLRKRTAQIESIEQCGLLPV